MDAGRVLCVSNAPTTRRIKCIDHPHARTSHPIIPSIDAQYTYIYIMSTWSSTIRRRLRLDDNERWISTLVGKATAAGGGSIVVLAAAAAAAAAAAIAFEPRSYDDDAVDEERMRRISHRPSPTSQVWRQHVATNATSTATASATNRRRGLPRRAAAGNSVLCESLSMSSHSIPLSSFSSPPPPPRPSSGYIAEQRATSRWKHPRRRECR